jgi:YihY family inner membrane protein
MNIFEKSIKGIDNFQKRHKYLAFSYAVIKKYGEDEAGYKAALLTYYGFLSLFPLLLVATTILGIIASSHPAIQKTVIDSLTSYFPVLSNQLSEHVHGLHRAGFALVIGVLFTFYGARGVADAFSHGVNDIWQVPKSKRTGFPKSLLKSVSLIFVGGAGFMLASLISTYAGAVAGKGLEFKLLSSAISLFILFWLFLALLKLSLPNHVGIKETRIGAGFAAAGLVGMQLIGSYVLGRQLKNLDSLYSSFAIALGLLFWIYLQAQVLYYAVEISIVEARHLWPRSITDTDLTPADRAAKKRLDRDSDV